MTNHRDQIMRGLEEVDATNTAVMPKFMDALNRVFKGEERLSMDQKAEILGVPTRRGFLRLGGVTVAGAAVLAACGDDDDAGTPTTEAMDDGSMEEGGGEMDLVLANTAISLEILAVDTYNLALGAPIEYSELAAAAATMFRDHHQAHADALSATVSGAGGTPVTEANAVVKAAAIDPAVPNLATEADVLALALELEKVAAQTYVFAAGALSTPALRSTIMTIGGVENRHAAILTSVLMGDAFENGGAFIPGTNPLPEGAVIGG